MIEIPRTLHNNHVSPFRVMSTFSSISQVSSLRIVFILRVDVANSSKSLDIQINRGPIYDNFFYHCKKKKLLHKNTIIYQFPGTAITMFQKLGDLETTEIYYLTVLEVRTLKSRCQQDHAPPEIRRGNPSSTLPSLFWVCHQSLVFLGLQMHNFNLCLHCHMVFSLCVTVFTWPPSYKDNSSVGLEPTLFQYDFIFNDFFPNKLIF